MKKFEERQVFVRSQSVNYGDIWALTTAQLGADLDAQLEQDSKFATTRANLVGRHVLQYGVTPRVIDEAIDLALRSSSFAFATAAHTGLKRVIIDRRKATPSELPLDRIVISHHPLLEALEKEIDANDSFELTTGLDHHRMDVPVLVPREGVAAYYQQMRSYTRDRIVRSGHTVLTVGGRMDRTWNMVTTARDGQNTCGIIDIREV